MSIPVLPKIFFTLALSALVLSNVEARGLESDYDCVRGFGGRLERIHVLAAEARREQAVVAERQAKAKKEAQLVEAGPGKIHETLVAMRDAVGVGEQVADYIERHANISVEFDTKETGISSTDEIGGSVPLITLRINAALPRMPRVLSIAIAKEAFEMMYAEMPESAEKDYMRASVVARVFVELGGSIKSLPVIEPLNDYKHEAMAAIVRSWYENNAANHPSLDTKIAEVKARITRLQKYYDEDLESSYTTHHPAPGIQEEVRQYIQAQEALKVLEHGRKLHHEFMHGVDYKDAQGNVHNNHKGETTWLMMYQGRI